MRLQVGFIHKINAITVAEIIPVRIIGIVGIADMIDIRSLHHHYVAYHVGAIYGMTALGVSLMTVYPFKLDGFAIDEVETT